jgi:hypothetical protein
VVRSLEGVMTPYVFIAAGLLLLGIAQSERPAAQHGGRGYSAASATANAVSPVIRYAAGP